MQRAIVFLFALNVFCLPASTPGQRSQIPTAATDATVKADTVTVFLEMDASSDQVSTLKKGITVYVDLRMDQGGKSWCGVRPSAQANRIGFVDCRSLQRVAGSTPAVVSGRSAADSESTHGSAADMPLERPATPTANGYAAMKNEVVKEGVIDAGLISTLEAQASRGGPTAITRAALALIEKARKLSPQSSNLAAWSGYTHYRMNQLDAAIVDLQTAQKIRPSQG